MQQLNSKNYEEFIVILRDEEDDPITLSVQSGTALQTFLATDHNKKHINLNRQDGTKTTVLITDIRRVEPVMKARDLSEYI